MISLEGRAEVSPSSQYYDNPRELFKQIVDKSLEEEDKGKEKS